LIRLAAAADAVLQIPYFQGIRALGRLAVYRLAALAEWFALGLPLLLAAAIDGALMRTVKTRSFAHLSPVLFGIGLHGAIAVVVCIVFALLLPIALHPVVWGALVAAFGSSASPSELIACAGNRAAAFETSAFGSVSSLPGAASTVRTTTKTMRLNDARQMRRRRARTPGSGAGPSARGGRARSRALDLHKHCQRVVPGGAGGATASIRGFSAIAKSSRAQPRAVNRSHEHRTGSVDLGLMQINSRWLATLARYGITREGLLEPCTSVMVGAWILADLFARHGTTWEAVGAYNAACTQLTREACTARRNAYAAKVHAALPIRLARGTREASPPTAQTLPVRARPAGILAVRVGSPDRDTEPGEPRVGQLPAENRDG
jgi:hypothetical protein